MHSATLALKTNRLYLPHPLRANQAAEFLAKEKLAEQADRHLSILNNYADTFRQLDNQGGTDLNTRDNGVVVTARGHGRAKWTGAMHYDPQVKGDSQLAGVWMMEWDQPNGETTVYQVDQNGCGVQEDRTARGDLLRKFYMNPNGTVTYEEY